MCQTPFYWDLSPKKHKEIRYNSNFLFSLNALKRCHLFFFNILVKNQVVVVTVKEYDFFRIWLGGGGGGYCDGMYRVPHKIH